MFQKSELVCINNDYNEDEGNISIGSLTVAAERGEATTTAGEGKSRWGSLLSSKVPPPTKCIIYCVVPERKYIIYGGECSRRHTC